MEKLELYRVAQKVRLQRLEKEITNPSNNCIKDYYKGCIEELKHQIDLLDIALPKESEVSHA